MKVRIWGARGSLGSPLKPAEVENKIVRAIHNMPRIDTSDIDAVESYVQSLPILQRGTAGGNTTCVEVQAGQKTIIIDAGTGIRELGLELMKGPCGRGEGELHLLFSHAHWDHIQGVPFFTPAYIPGNCIKIYSFHDLETVLTNQQQFITFPVPLSYMTADLEFVRLQEDQPFSIGDVRISAIRNAHPGDSYGYRFEDEYSAFVFASDSEFKSLHDSDVQPHIHFYSNADALIFDAQYTLGEGWLKEDWGHSSAMIGVEMALVAGVKRLVLFHHEPTHDDSTLQQILANAEQYRDTREPQSLLEILVAHEGLTLNLAPTGAVDLQLGDEESHAVHLATSVFDEESVMQIAAQLATLDAKAITQGSVIDLSRVETLSTAGLKLLVKLQQEGNHGPALLAAAPSNVIQTIELGGFSNCFAIYESVDAAFTALRARNEAELPGQILAERYRIDRLLSKTTLETVLLAKDESTDDQVTVKIADAAYNEEAIERLLNARNQLIQVNHPNLLPVLHLSREEQCFFLVETFHQGPTLAGLLLENDGMLPAERSFEIALAILEAVETLHGRGIVHGNLNTHNIFVDEEGVQVGGLAVGALEQGRNLLETPLLHLKAGYVAPEQVRGRRIDARSDLYAVGILLYELFTGRVPFIGADQQALQAHLSNIPRSPDKLNASLSPSLTHLILRLLAKNPGDRYESAAAVRHILSALLVNSDETWLERKIQLVDRDADKQLIKTAWRSAQAGEGRLIFIGGEAGLGKSTLAEQTAREIGAHVVLIGRCQEDRRNGIFAPFVEALSAYLAYVPPELADSSSVDLLRDFARVVPSVRHLLPDLTLPQALEPEQEQVRQINAMVQFMARSAQSHPWILILDDLQWADEVSLELLRDLAFDLTHVPMLILATYRSEDVAPDSPVANLFTRLEANRAVSRLDLTRLDAAGVAAILRQQWDQDVPGRLVEAVYRQTGGNPFFVEEVAKHLLDESQIIVEHDEWRYPNPDAIRLPETLHEVIRQRVFRLNDYTQELLQQASVLGRSFGIETLREMTGKTQWAILEHLDIALQIEFIEETAGAQMLRFRHDGIQNALYELIPSIRLRLWHRQAGQALERLSTPDTASIADVLTFHYSVGGDLERAIPYGFQAARQAQSLYANRAAIEWYQQVLSSLSTLSRELDAEESNIQVEANLNLGQVLELRGDLADAEMHYEAAVVLAAEAGSNKFVAQAQMALGEIARKQNRFDLAEKRLLEAQEKFSKIDDQVGVAQALRQRGNVAHQQGKFTLAKQRYHDSLEICRNEDYAKGEASALSNLSIVARNAGELAAARVHAQHSLAIRESIDDQWGIGASLDNLGLIAVDSRELEDARAYLERALKIYRNLGSRQGITNALHNLANVARELGHASEARRLYADSARGWLELENRWGIAYWLEDTGVFQLQRGAPLRALQLVDAASALREQIGSPRPPAYAQKLEKTMAAAQQTLDDETVTDARTAGRALSQEEAIELALSVNGNGS